MLVHHGPSQDTQHKVTEQTTARCLDGIFTGPWVLLSVQKC